MSAHSSHMISSTLRSSFPLNFKLKFYSTFQKYSIFDTLIYCNNLKSLTNLLSISIINGWIQSTDFFAKETIRKLIEFGDPESAYSLCRSIGNPTLSFQNWTLKCLANYGFYNHILSLFAESQCFFNFFGADNYTYPILIKACTAVSEISTGEQIHCVIVKSGYGKNVGIQTAILDMYAKFGCLDCSEQLFDEMSLRDLVTWNAMISGYSVNGYYRKALEIFNLMTLNNFKPNVSSLINMFSGANRLGGLSYGKSLHALATKCGALKDEALVSSLISMYSGFADLSSAGDLFATAEKKDIVPWNAMISGYMQNSKSRESFKVFQLLPNTGIRPNLITFVSLLPSCVDLDSIFYGEMVHTIAIKLGLADQISVLTSLVSMYSKFGDLTAAVFLFLSVPQKTLVLWNSMTSGYLLNGFVEKSLDIFRKMQLCGIFPDEISMIHAISGCTEAQDFCCGKSVHAYSLKHGFDSNTNIINGLLSFYSEFEQLSSFDRLFNHALVRNEVSWNITISRFAKMKDVDSITASFSEMYKEGIKFDAVSLINALPAFCKTENLMRGICFHSLSIISGYCSDISLTNAFISMYANCGDLKSSQLLFEDLLVKNIVSWNVLMTGYRNNHFYGEVIKVFETMKSVGEKPNEITLLNLLPVSKNQLQGKSIHGYSLRNHVKIEGSLLTSFISMYSRFANLNSCRLLFNTADKGNIIIWNMIMSAYVQNKNTEEAVATFRKLLRTGPRLDALTILNLVLTHSHLCNLDLAKSVAGFVFRNGFENNIPIRNSMIDMFTRCGSISMARCLFDTTKEKDSVAWSIMINAYGIHGDGKAAVEIYSKMEENRIEPDGVTFLSLLSACSHTGLVEEGRNFFKNMLKNNRIVPRVEHYACLVDLLSRTGHLDEAYDVIKRMPFSPSSSLLESLLGACHCYGNIEIGKAVGKMLIDSDPSSSSCYVTVSNIHSAAGRWKESELFRCDMDSKGVRKDPGISLLESGI